MRTKLKTLCRQTFCLLAALYLLAAVLPVFTHQQSPGADSASGLSEACRMELEAAYDLLADLAFERFCSNSNRNEVWILAVHRGEGVRSFTDGRFIMLSLPFSKPETQGAVCGYVNQYNSLNLKHADQLAEKGHYAEARDICRLVEHFACRGSLVADLARQRLRLLERLIAGDKSGTPAKELRALFVDFRSRHDLSAIQRQQAIAVTNLFQIPKEWVK
jgi:hypothetical protein